MKKRFVRMTGVYASTEAYTKGRAWKGPGNRCGVLRQDCLEGPLVVSECHHAVLTIDDVIRRLTGVRIRVGLGEVQPPSEN